MTREKDGGREAGFEAPVSDAAPPPQLVRQMFHSTADGVYAVELLRRDGSRTPAILSSAVLCDDTGREIGGVETIRDLSAVQRSLHRLERQQPLAALLTDDAQMRHIFDLLPTIALSESCVLITGETGTGKNLVARAIHNISERREGPFVTVNCAALPESLLESELFGYRAGAFTGATRDRIDRVAAAEGARSFWTRSVTFRSRCR